ncbi:hypothetical protein LXL04_017079 [Taraxacum kok-saghyz]
MNRKLPLILYWFILGVFNLVKVYGNDEGDALNDLKTQLKDPNNILKSWDSTLANPCTWFGVTCNDEKSVIRLELFGNNISGRIPNEIGNLTKLVTLKLYMNRLEGNIPDTLGNLQHLCNLSLSNNNLTGAIPISLTTIASLQVIDLSNNFLIGDVPFNGSFSMFTASSFANNPNLRFVPRVPEAPPRPPRGSPNSQKFSVGNNDVRAISEGFVVGLALVFAGRAVSLTWRLCKKRQDHFIDVPADEDLEIYHGQLRRFSFHELQIATDEFSKNNIIGRGGFSKVYKGRLVDGSLVAVKRIFRDGQGCELQYQIEIEMLSMAVHKNLLRVQGFCMTPTERLLVYPFMVNGSVASCLPDRRIDWPTRKRIAVGSARGLAYLHDHCDPMIIHRDVKAANILLEEEFEAVVGDFGLAKLMNPKNTHVTTDICGTIGHIGPEYLSTGKISEKTDVFGYGMMLLELSIGQHAIDLARLAYDDGFTLLDWVKGLLREKKLEVPVDVDLKFNYSKDILEELIQIALLCTQVAPSQRPKMLEVVEMLEGDGPSKFSEWQVEKLVKFVPKDSIFDDRNWILPNSPYNPCSDQISNPR